KTKDVTVSRTAPNGHARRAERMDCVRLPRCGRPDPRSIRYSRPRRPFEQARAGEDRPVDRLVDVRFACTIPGDGRAAKHTGPGCSRKLRIVRQHAPGKQRKHHAARVEKGDPLPARPRFADKSELLVETDAAPEVIDPERQQGDTRSVGRHDTIPTSSALRTDSAAPPQEMAA